MLRSTPRSVLIGLALTLLGASCLLDRSTGDLEPGGSGAGGEGGTSLGECATSDQCEASPTLCQIPACVDGVCTYANKSAGSPCENGGACDEEGLCKAVAGQLCDTDSACYTASCVDGVCCDTACDGLCSSCAVAGLEGTCSPEPSGTVSGDCPSSTCDGLGACVAGELSWGVTFGGYLSYAEGYAIAPDTLGNSYLLTEVEWDVDFGANVLATGGSRDIALVKLDPNGAPSWAFHMPSTLDAYAYDVAVTSDGGAVAGGFFYGELETKLAPLVSDGDADGWVVRFGPDASDAPAFAKKIGGSGHARVFTVAASPEGDDVLAGGAFTTTVDFGGGTTVDSLGGFDAFAVRLGGSGNVVWQQTFRGTGSSGVAEILFDGDDAIAVGGFTETVTLDQPRTATDGDIFLARLDASGTPQSSLTLGSEGNQEVTAAARTPDGGLVLVGYYDTGFVVDTQTLPFEGVTSFDDDVFVIRLDADGQLVWARSFNGSSALRAWDVAVDAAGNVVVAGSFQGTATIAGEQHTAFNLGYTDAYLAKLAPDGSTHWVRVYGETWDDALFGVGVDAAGHAYAAGAFEDAVTLGTSLSAEGYVDVFAVNLGP